ncbi:MAG: cupredoxin domain-containing protein [Actinomycetota bacterium]
MLRLRTRVILVAFALAVFLQSDALAGTVNVSMFEYDFSPDPAKVKMGDTLHWTNDGAVAHTTTQDSPLSLWDSGIVSPGGTFDFVLYAAGIYKYHCTFHVALGMVAAVGAKPTASPPSGPVGTIFTITVATIDAPAGFVYDVQKRNPGGSFQDWMTGIITKSASFDSTGQPTGTYQFRSRLRKVSNNGASGYSPKVPIMVTP